MIKKCHSYLYLRDSIQKGDKFVLFECYNTEFDC